MGQTYTTQTDLSNGSFPLTLTLSLGERGSDVPDSPSTNENNSKLVRQTSPLRFRLARLQRPFRMHVQTDPLMSDQFTRRQFLATSATAVTATALGGLGLLSPSPACAATFRGKISNAMIIKQV